MKGNEVEMSKIRHSQQISQLPQGWKYAGRSAFRPFRVEQVRASIQQLLSSQPSQPWYFPQTRKGLCYIWGTFQWESSLGAHLPQAISQSALPRELMGWTTPGWEPEGQPWRQGLCLQTTQPPALLRALSALLCLNLCSQRPSCSQAADTIRKPKQLFSHKDCKCSCVHVCVRMCVCCFSRLNA